MHHKEICEEFERIAPTLQKKYYHDIDPWFERNENYYFYKIEHFPFLSSLVKQVRCIDTSVAAFAVIDGPMVIPPHRAESNELLRYQLTLRGDGDCSLYTEKGVHVHREGQDFLFDHARYHELVKTGDGRRVVLILDVKRF
jgi:aspartyl/asparaginyl beta-hydroxylase (cupin superfamily)